MDVPAAPHSPADSVSVEITVASSEEMRALGRRLAALVRAGDLVMLSGELGAGKTTLTRGLGEGLNVRGAVTSPTFVIARVHPSLGDGPPLVHVDAYRLSGGLEEMEDLDLDVSLPESVVVVEWGEGKVEELTEERLQVRIHRSLGTAPDASEVSGAPDADEVRQVVVTGIGRRWQDVDLKVLAR
ncbi:MULTISPECIES: tRNA (adenosine(37)-N6)-threonylcarbamoyltransferase complex ATPase subunit type 1 TsaE [Streptomyces]|uniref:tRNA threonylcarbamoyladenosine biosynthesis protein TsaE n=1 Tax=Streptomyces thermoviolaceus subsp. thermoviolaceus TaxID=66860 RepID=A0ABX0YPW2_STRTL|nr:MULTISPECIES: tRNA (adenosine(37)-N6)-threonylcarbamoyltransferase complex ATPase subunit type 1 TsaE [Streptomyces]MCM3263676.1 tRNA (adenosine(37)-N6)-threonylcarbamoyltransferase complex ATPase subunit type 1 TsaE [Streptomyces thermoviolaceus]NJP14597.1 tRNA (adenosine(37)-N6)-threonylcarbamoyltransferase complex ATPase subunit type 1 TsaE [Streptomyces thermoviolaceus subsp. thermoviolaceus]RSS07959.1 tRNA (adenosine(37)-N6)-threonylcarbamoyltransferase complex ATPase subunit type 1 TsaE